MRPDALVLGLDSSAAHCAAALVSGGSVRAARAEAMETGQAERLMPMLGALMAGAGAGWRDLDGIGVGTGPGNFTGIRIAVAAARGLALALARPAIGISRFEALAEGLPRPLLVLLDGRQDRLAWQVFGAAGPEAPGLAEAGALAARAWPPGLAVTGHRAGEVAALIGARALGEADLPDAATIARLAAARLDRPAPRPAPLYLRPADAMPAAEAPPPLLP